MSVNSNYESDRSNNEGQVVAVNQSSALWHFEGRQVLPSGTKRNETRSQETSPASSKRRMRSDVELLTKRRSSTEMQWHFVQSEEH